MKVNDALHKNKDKMTRQPYTCPRCGYKTQKKSNFYNHLFKKLIECPAEVSNIVLTDEFKEHLMKNRVWNPNISLTPLTPHQVQEMTLTISPNKRYNFARFQRKCRGTLYLIHIFPNNPVPVYKIGKTKRFVGDRIQEYEPHSPIVLLCCECYDCDAYEKELLAIFKSKFTRRTDIGLEYFSGDPGLMKAEFLKFILDKQTEENNVRMNNDNSVIKESPQSIKVESQ